MKLITIWCIALLICQSQLQGSLQPELQTSLASQKLEQSRAHIQEMHERHRQEIQEQLAKQVSVPEKLKMIQELKTKLEQEGKKARQNAAEVIAILKPNFEEIQKTSRALEALGKEHEEILVTLSEAEESLRQQQQQAREQLAKKLQDPKFSDDDILALAKLPLNDLKYFTAEIARNMEDLDKLSKAKDIASDLSTSIKRLQDMFTYEEYLGKGIEFTGGLKDIKDEIEPIKRYWDDTFLDKLDLSSVREQLNRTGERLTTYDIELARVLFDKINGAKLRAADPKKPLTNNEKAIIEMVFKETPKLIEKILADMEKDKSPTVWIANQRRLFLLANLTDLYITSLDAKVGYDSSIASRPLVRGTLNLVAGLATTLVTVLTAAAFVTGAVLFFMLPLTQFGLILGISLTSLVGAVALEKLPKIVDIARSGWSFGNWVEQKMNERVLETYKKSYPAVLSSITKQLQMLSPTDQKAAAPYIKGLESAVKSLSLAYEMATKNLENNIDQKDLVTFRQAVSRTVIPLINKATQDFMNALKPGRLVEEEI